jgi:hypothetical protein
VETLTRSSPAAADWIRTASAAALFECESGESPAGRAADLNFHGNLEEQFVDFGGGSGSEESSAGDEQEGLSEGFDFVEYVAGDEDASAGCDPVFQESRHLGAADGIESAEGFVEDEEFGVVSDGLSEFCAAVAFRGSSWRWVVACCRPFRRVRGTVRRVRGRRFCGLPGAGAAMWSIRVH